MDLSSLLYAALQEEVGLVVRTPDPDRLLRKFYHLRKKHAAFEVLSFIRTPDPNVIWILKRTPSDD